ncbi:uncharacterized protein LOC100371995 [Saccoglossus kowalevskii]
MKTTIVPKGMCLLCHKDVDNKLLYGELFFHQESQITVHHYCLLFACGLIQRGEDNEGIQGFLPADILKEARRGSKLKCSYCHSKGAAAGCCIPKCKHKFHYPCGKDFGVLSQFFGGFSSYCKDHRPKQTVHKVSEKEHICPICICEVPSTPGIDVLKTPCCKDNWLHRDCVQSQALNAGSHFFRCPICNNQEKFKNEMLQFGIFIPEQDASWELEENAFQDLLARHNQCDVADCLCPQGRHIKEEASIWDIILCDMCGSVGSHLRCSNLKTPEDDWICCDCESVVGKDNQNEDKSNNVVTPHKGMSSSSPQTPQQQLRAMSISPLVVLDRVPDNPSPLTWKIWQTRRLSVSAKKRRLQSSDYYKQLNRIASSSESLWNSEKSDRNGNCSVANKASCSDMTSHEDGASTCNTMFSANMSELPTKFDEKNKFGSSASTYDATPQQKSRSSLLRNEVTSSLCKANKNDIPSASALTSKATEPLSKKDKPTSSTNTSSCAHAANVQKNVSLQSSQGMPSSEFNRAKIFNNTNPQLTSTPNSANKLQGILHKEAQIQLHLHTPVDHFSSTLSLTSKRKLRSLKTTPAKHDLKHADNIHQTPKKLLGGFKIFVPQKRSPLKSVVSTKKRMKTLGDYFGLLPGTSSPGKICDSSHTSPRKNVKHQHLESGLCSSPSRLCKEHTQALPNVKKLQTKKPDTGVESSPLREKGVESSSLRKKSVELSPLRKLDIESSPLRKQGIESSPLRKQGVESSPLRKLDVESSPLRKQGVESSPLSRLNDESSPLRKLDVESSPLRKQGVESSPLSRLNDESSPLRKLDVESSPLRKQGVESSPLSRLNDESSPLRKLDVESSPLRKQGVRSSSLSRLNDESSPLRKLNDESSPLRKLDDESSLSKLDVESLPLRKLDVESLPFRKLDVESSLSKLKSKTSKESFHSHNRESRRSSNLNTCVDSYIDVLNADSENNLTARKQQVKSLRKLVFEESPLSNKDRDGLILKKNENSVPTTPNVSPQLTPSVYPSLSCFSTCLPATIIDQLGSSPQTPNTHIVTPGTSPATPGTSPDLPTAKPVEPDTKLGSSDVSADIQKRSNKKNDVESESLHEETHDVICLSPSSSVQCKHKNTNQIASGDKPDAIKLQNGMTNVGAVNVSDLEFQKRLHKPWCQLSSSKIIPKTQVKKQQKHELLILIDSDDSDNQTSDIEIIFEGRTKARKKRRKSGRSSLHSIGKSNDCDVIVLD